jgi:6-phosphogluconate dehydrogenase
MSNFELGVIGLGTMGQNIARNAERQGATVAVYNRTTSKMTDFMEEFGDTGDFIGCETYEELAEALTPPRAVLSLVSAGKPVDYVIDDLLKHFDEGDIIIDGGNSNYQDTERRTKELKEKGISYIGMGVSGGEKGALEGPSMMPGGDLEGYKKLEPLLKKMAADDGAGGDCVTFVGERGGGHFVKTVHNGIEYGIMQCLAESYDVLKNVGDFTNEELANAYGDWNETDLLNGYLMEITEKIFRRPDDKTDKDLIDVIKDAAKQKGTGMWTTKSSFDYGVAVPTITAGVEGRIISGHREIRGQTSGELPTALNNDASIPSKDQLRDQVQSSLELSIISAYIQGFLLIKQANEENDWGIDMKEVARIWRGGCIIRSNLLPLFEDVLSQDESTAQSARQKLLDIAGEERQLHWRKLVQVATGYGVPVRAISSSLNWFDSFRKGDLPQNLTQAQRDFFGSHTYERVDEDGTFHTDWNR